MTTKKTDDMTDRGSYNIEHRFYDGPWQVYFAAVAGPYLMGSYDPEEEAKEAIAQRIEAARECARQEEARRLREAEERVATARQQIPEKFRGLNLAEYPGARNFIGTDDRTLLFGDVDAANLQAACAILIEAAREGHSTRFMAVNDVFASRVSEIAASDFLLLNWPGAESKDADKVARIVDEVLRLREGKVTMVTASIPRTKLAALLESARTEWTNAECRGRLRQPGTGEV